MLTNTINKIEACEPWRQVWRRGVAPELTTAGLETLYRLLAYGDGGRLLQRSTCAAQPRGYGAPWPGGWFGPGLPAADWLATVAEAGCPLTVGAGGLGRTLAAAADLFLSLRTRVDARLAEAARDRRLVRGVPLTSGDFVSWWDAGHPGDVRRELGGEVMRALSQRRRAAVLAWLRQRRRQQAGPGALVGGGGGR